MLGPMAVPEQQQPTAPPGHDERLWPGPGGWALVAGAGVLAGVVLVPLDLGAALVAALAGGGLAAVAAVRTSARVRVADGVLQVGKASIPVALLGPPAVLDRDGVRARLGPGSDARTYVCVRAWVRGGVVVDVRDPQDPTPAWLVSSRRPDRLAAALRAAQGDGPPDGQDGQQDEQGQAAHSEQIG